MTDSNSPPPDEPQTLNVACPNCTAQVTHPIKVETRKGDESQVDVTMNCDTCQQTFIVQKLTDNASNRPA